MFVCSSAVLLAEFFVICLAVGLLLNQKKMSCTYKENNTIIKKKRRSFYIFYLLYKIFNLKFISSEEIMVFWVM